MISASILYLDLIITIFILGLCLCVLAISYARTLRRVEGLAKNEDDIKIIAYKKASSILEEARNKGLKIIADANVFENSSKQTFQQELNKVLFNQVNNFEKISSEFMNVYKKELESVKEEDIKNIKKISKDIESLALGEVDSFKEVIKRQTFDSQKIVEEKIEKDYEGAKKSVEEYKLERIKKVDQEIYQILENVSLLVLGKVLSLQEHEKLVIEALNKAKKEQVITK